MRRRRPAAHCARTLQPALQPQLGSPTPVQNGNLCLTRGYKWRCAVLAFGEYECLCPLCMYIYTYIQTQSHDVCVCMNCMNIYKYLLQISLITPERAARAFRGGKKPLGCTPEGASGRGSQPRVPPERPPTRAFAPREAARRTQKERDGRRGSEAEPEGAREEHLKANRSGHSWTMHFLKQND